MFFSPCLYTISCYHTSIYFLLGPSFIPTICSKVIPIFFRNKFSLLSHELLLSNLIFLSSSFTISFFPFHMLCASVTLAFMFLVLTNDAPAFFHLIFSFFLYWKVDCSNRIPKKKQSINIYPFKTK